MSEETQSDQGGNMSPDDLVVYHFGKIAAAAKAKSTTDAGMRNAFAAADRAGIDIKAIKIAREGLNADDPGAVLNRLKQAVRYMQVLGCEEARQYDLLDTVEPDRTPDDERAWKRGHTDGLSGADRDNIYGIGTAQYERYEAGYDEGRKTLTAFDAGSEVVEVARSKPKDEADDDGADILDVDDAA